MNIEIIKPHPLLKDHVDLIFVFSGKTPPPKEDLKLIVPNGRIKLIIPIQNGLVANVNGWTHTSRQNKLTLTGIGDMPAKVDFETQGPAANITVEFSPM